MAKKNKPNAGSQPQNSRNENQAATAPASNKTVSSTPTRNGASRNRTLVIVMGIIILLILAVVLLALLLTNRNEGGNGTDDATTSETTTGQVDGSNTTSDDATASDTTTSQSTTTSEDTANGDNGDDTDNGNGNVSGISTDQYTETAGAGDSVSYLARRAMYKYFQATGNALHTRGQRLFFEVTLTNASNPVALNAGETRTFSAETMASVLAQAKALSASELAAWENAAVAANYQ